MLLQILTRCRARIPRIWQKRQQTTVMHDIPSASSVIGFTADSILPKRTVDLNAAAINKHGRLQVVMNDQKLEYPAEWLRRSCQCSKCHNPFSLSYVNSIQELLREKAGLQSVSSTKDGVECVFSDGHVGKFSTDWLYKCRLTADGNQERQSAIFLHKTVPWPHPKEMKVQKCSYAEVTETESGFEKFGTELVRDGIFIITDSPTDRPIYQEFGDKTGLRPLTNHYGPVWVVENLPNPTNHAYTTAELDLHVDQPYLARCPSIQLLHCMEQSKIGGENIMCDGIKAAMVLRERHPDYYKILTTLDIQQQDLVAHKDQQQFYMAHIAPTIVADKNGEPATIQFNHAAQSTFFPGTAEDYEEYSKALKAFLDILYEYAITLKTEPGDILIFDNQRILHGRLGYDPSFGRKLAGSYLDWDMVHSRLRVSMIKKNQMLN